MTYAEKELLPLGFRKVEETDSKVILSLGHLKLQFDCVCPAYPNIKALGCSLHHSGPGSSWPVVEAKKVVTLSQQVETQSRKFHECGFCGAEFSTVDDLYAHQQKAHDPGGIMFSELGLPK